MKGRLKILILTGIILIVSVIIYRIDPVFKREVSFDKYSVKYEWRIFNNSYCNSKSAGHCFTNKVNRINAENELYIQLLDNYNGEEKIEQKLKEVVNKSYRYDMTYSDLTKTRNVEIDSLKKYKDIVFRKIMLK